VVIEDIPERTIVVWRSVVGLINQTNFHARLVKTSSPHMVVAERVM
jgi:hypothetical protein